MLENFARKYRGEFTYHDFLNDNKVRIFALGFTEFLCFSAINVGKDVSLAFRGLGRGFLSASLKNSLAINLPLCYAASSESNHLRYFDFMIKFTTLNVLLIPIQASALASYWTTLG